MSHYARPTKQKFLREVGTKVPPVAHSLVISSCSSRRGWAGPSLGARNVTQVSYMGGQDAENLGHSLLPASSATAGAGVGRQSQETSPDAVRGSWGSWWPAAQPSLRFVEKPVRYLGCCSEIAQTGFPCVSRLCRPKCPPCCGSGAMCGLRGLCSQLHTASPLLHACTPSILLATSLSVPRCPLCVGCRCPPSGVASSRLTRPTVTLGPAKVAF